MTIWYYLLSFISGTALTIQVGVNGQLRNQVESPVLSSLISFAVGTLCLALVFSFFVFNGTYTLPKDSWSGLRWWMFTGGALGAFYLFTTIAASPRIGFANMFSLVVCGQMLLTILFDHFGLLGNQVHLLTIPRALGLVLLLSGVYLIQKF
ncbi:DMT family transporter [Aminipila butyrica]|uniref:DMT family transporter n=1 Tax=Aminipila butyrica TaxID=433296 RepID=A0A858BS29_9FIRM|nr:DMT family transporter [Aminipila butyrica]QIB68761.1 DMT family transporter [Aminipila butyrica]